MRNHLRFDDLTERELTCLTLLACGYRVDTIADELGVSAMAATVYLDLACKKLHAHSVAQAVAVALAIDLIPREAILNATRGKAVN